MKVLFSVTSICLLMPKVPFLRNDFSSLNIAEYKSLNGLKREKTRIHTT